MIPNIHKILYATDLSPNSVYALGYAINTALKHRAEIVFLYVFDNVDPVSRVYIDDRRHREIFDQHKTKAQNIINKRLAEIRGNELKEQPDFLDKAVSIEICEGFPVEVILSKADELNCDMIVMGTHSKGVIANTFLGSTAKRVLRRTRKPVLVIPLPKEEKDIDFEDM